VTHQPEYRVMLSPGARRALAERLPLAVAAAVWEFINGPLAQDPHRVGKPLLEPLKGLWSARRGAYRVLYRIDDTQRIVRVERIDHRADVYRT
jgi:mRNA-degrading endonuclease RelE of RelBE toxin-antitoxin system